MSIRKKLVFALLLVLLSLGGIGWFTYQLSRAHLEEIRTVGADLDTTLDLAREARSSYRAQVTAWKDLLLRGTEKHAYHHYLSAYYEAERRTRELIRDPRLRAAADFNPELSLVLRMLDDAHIAFGRKLRHTLRLFNATPEDGHALADRVTEFYEMAPRDLLERTIGLVEDIKRNRLGQIEAQFGNSILTIAASALVALLLTLTAIIWRVDRQIARPAEHASLMADIMGRAERLAQFGIWEWDIRADHHTWSEGLRTLFGIERDGVRNFEVFLSIVHHDDRERVCETVSSAERAQCAYEIEYRIVRPDGVERVIEEYGRTVISRATGATVLTRLLHDVTERKQAEAQLMEMANFDTLTGLPNRRLFRDRCGHALAGAKRSGQKVALLFLDLDRFKAINDALGHAAGDALLLQVAERLRGRVRSSDTVARLGGDEFIVILEDIDSTATITDIVEDLQQTLARPYEISEREMFVTASIGVTVFPRDGETPEALLKNADAAMYRAKELGRNAHHYFTEELNELAVERLSLENGLRKALAQGDFELHYQPQVNLSNGAIEGVEALLRWSHEAQAISPAKFIPLLEETGLILPVGEWVLEQACHRLLRLHAEGFSALGMSVNLSVIQMRQGDIAATVAAIIERTGIDAASLELEITEGVLLDPHVDALVFNRLKNLGVRLAIDDFGTGYSSLSVLKRFPFDTLKIDRSFIQDVVRRRDEDRITSAIVTMAHTLGMRVVAEGVELPAQFDFLSTCDCDLFQGFLASRALPAADLSRWLRQQNGISRTDGQVVSA